MEWKITIEAWPHSTGRGQTVDQKEAGSRSTDYIVCADDMAGALKIGKYLAMGIEHNPMVWKAPIMAIVRER